MAANKQMMKSSFVSGDSSSGSLSPRSSSDNSLDEIIAVFGGHGSTGRHFIKLALDAGYQVNALAPVASSIELSNSSEQVRVVEGDLDDSAAIQNVLTGATYVVCLLGDTLPKKRKEYSPNCMTEFIKLLYPLMVEQTSIRVFLYQASSLTRNADKQKTPVLANVLKVSTNIVSKNHSLRDHDQVVQYIVENANEYFDYIVTRPGLMREGASKKKLAASKSLPGPIPVTYVDLAEFSLGALKIEKLYNTCPYVVGDGF